MNREAIYSALWAKLDALDGFVTKSRKLLHWNDVKRYDQPALFMAQGDMQAVTLTGQETKWILRVDVYLYVQTSGEPPAPIMNPLIDAVWDGADIEYCRVEGTVETDEGTLGEQAVCIIPIMICAA